MQTKLILSRLNFGHDAAETDDRLDLCFIPTSDFDTFVSDRADLVIGVKGSGKTALFRQLSNADFEIPQLHTVDVVPAFNASGAVVFRRLEKVSSPSEGTYRDTWFAYLVAMAGNHIVETYASRAVDTLRDALDAHHLLVEAASPRRIWDRVTDIVRGLLDGEVEVEVQNSPDSPVSIRAAAKREQVEDAHLDSSAWESLLELAQLALEPTGHRVWILLDRLDEAFHTSSDVENVALRGLLRAHLDMVSYGPAIRPKIFLRNDILDRITRDSGFVNLTHLRRQHLRWDADAILHVVSSRAAFKPGVRRALGLRPNATPNSVCRRLFPEKINGQSYINWLLDVTTDASDEPNPRNVISLLNFAKDRQLRRDDRTPRSYRTTAALIQSETWRAAAADLSKLRYTDTVLAEAPQLRPVLEMLTGRAYRYTKEQLAITLGLDADSDDFQTTVDDLTYFGIMRELTAGLFEVPVLYRPALKLRQPMIKTVTAPTLTKTRSRHLLRLIEDATSAILDGRESEMTLPYLEPHERKFVHQEVQAISLDVATESLTDDGHGRKEVRLFRLPPRAFVDTADDITIGDVISDETLNSLYLSIQHGIDQVELHNHHYFVAPFMMRHEAEVIAALTRESELETDVRVVAMLLRSDQSVACIVARDLVRRSLGEGDDAVLEPEGQAAIKHVASVVAEAVLETGLPCQTRPFGPRALARAIEVLGADERLDVQILGGSSARLSVKPRVPRGANAGSAHRRRK